MRALLEQIEELDENEVYGRVVGVRGLMVEVVGFSGGHALLMPFAPLEGVRRGCRAVVSSVRAAVRPSQAWLGRVVNAMGEPIDGKGPLASGPTPYPFRASPPAAHTRQRIGAPIDL